MTRVRAGLVLVVLSIGGACAANDGGRSRDALRLGAGPRPPPKPGSSITHTKMCSCYTCQPRSCCDGSSEPELPPECTSGGGAVDPAECVLQVQSCEPRCSERVFRVRSNQSCDEHRPSDCC